MEMGQCAGSNIKQIKIELSKPRILALYDVNADMKISVDASSYGLGAVLLQRENQPWQPVIYAVA